MKTFVQYTPADSIVVKFATLYNGGYVSSFLLWLAGKRLGMAGAEKSLRMTLKSCMWRYAFWRCADEQPESLRWQLTIDREQEEYLLAMIATSYPTISEDEIVELARGLIKDLKDQLGPSGCWSIFPGYEGLEEIDGLDISLQDGNLHLQAI